MKDASGFDLVIEIDRMMLPKVNRAAIATHAIWLIRHPFILSELETTLFPTMQTATREFEGLSQVWIFDTVLEEGSTQAIELLTRVPVHVVPFLWTSTIAESHMKKVGISSWMNTTVAELRKLQGTDAMPAWKPHIAERILQMPAVR